MRDLMLFLARATALTGGAVLCAMILLVAASVTGRAGGALGLSPIRGDFELVEAGIAFAVFAFLPLCQLMSGHATVDIFTRLLPSRADLALRAFWEVLLALAILLIAWRLFAGMQDKIGNGQTTFLLQFPVWWAYAASFAASCVAVIVAVYCAFARIVTALTGHDSLPAADEAPE